MKPASGSKTTRTTGRWTSAQRPSTAATTVQAAEYKGKKRRASVSCPPPTAPPPKKSYGRELAKRLAKAPKATPYDKDDPHAMPTEAPLSDLRVHLGYLEEAIEGGAHALTGEEQSHVEVLTGKRLQQRTPQGEGAEPRKPEILPPGEPGKATEPVYSVLEPQEHGRRQDQGREAGRECQGYRE